MPRTIVPIQTPGPTGNAPTYAAADGVNGMAFFNTGSAILHVKNGSAAPVNVTLTTGGQVDGLTLPNQVIAVPAGADRMLSLRHQTAYTQVDGLTYVDFSAAASVTVGLFQGGAA